MDLGTSHTFGSYVLAFDLAEHTQDLTELCSKYDEDPLVRAENNRAVPELED